MSNEVEIHVTARDDTGRVFATVKGKAKRAGGEAGDEFTGSFSGKLSKQSVAAVEKAAKDVEAKAKPAFEKAGESAGKSMAKGVDKGGKDVDKATERVAKRTNAKFEAIKFAVFTSAMPAAAAAGAAGVGVALTGAALGFAALGVYAASGTAEVRKSFSDLKGNVLADVKAMGGPIDETIAGAIDHVNEAWDRMKPAVAGAVQGSAPLLDDLLGSVTDLAEKAMPGFVVAIARAGPELKGFRSLTGDVGAGLSDMLVNMSSQSAAAGQGMTIFGKTLRDLEGFAGQLFANLASGSSGPLTQFRGALGQVEGVILTLTSGGLSTLNGVASGFLGTISGGLAIVQGFASALGSWSAPLGQLGGTLLATNSMAKLFGTSLVESGFGLKAFATSVDSAGNKTSPFRTALADTAAGGNKFSRGLSAIASGGFNPLGVALVVGGVLLDAWGKKAQQAANLAAEQKAAVSDLTRAYMEDNGAIGANVRAVTQKALSDKNAFLNNQIFGASLQQTAAAGLNNASALETVNGKAKSYITSILSGSDANRQMLPQVLEAADAFAKQGGNATDLVDNLSAVRMHHLDLTDTQRAALIATLDGVTATNAEARAQQQAAKEAAALAEANRQIESAVARGMTPAMYGAKAASDDLDAAFKTLNASGGDVASKGQAIIEVMQQLAGITPSVDEAMQKWNDHMRLAKDSFAKVKEQSKEFPKDMINAAGKINTFSQAGSQLQDVLQQAATDMASYGQALKDSGQSADQITPKLADMRAEFGKHLKELGLNDKQIQSIMDHYGMLPDKIVTQLSLEGDEVTQQQIADVVTQMKTLPLGRSITVDALTEPAIASLESLGVKVEKMPDGKFRLMADTAAAQKAITDFNVKTAAEVITNRLFTDTGPAMGQVKDWQNITSTIDGKTTTYTYTDPASTAVSQWKVTTDATGARTTTYADISAAGAAVRMWKQNTDGTWSQVHASAETSAAEAALNWAARHRTAVIQGVFITPSTSGLGAAANRLAKGGQVGYASGGAVSSVPRFAGGGADVFDVRPGGLLRGQGTGTSDSMMTMTSRGPAAMSNGEFVVRASQTKKHMALLNAINLGIDGFASGGMVKYGSVSQGEWDSLYASGWRGNPNDGMEALYAPSIGGSSSAGSSPGRLSSSAGSSSQRGGAITVHIDISGGDQALMQWLRGRIRVEGGNVQTVLGRG